MNDLARPNHKGPNFELDPLGLTDFCHLTALQGSFFERV